MKCIIQAESHRIKDIFIETNDNLNLLSKIPLYPNESFLSETKHSHFNEIVKSIWKNENQLKKIENTSTLFDSQDISILKETHKSVKKCFNQNIKLNTHHELSEEFSILIEKIQQLTDGYIEKLSTTIEDEEAQNLRAIDLGDKTRLLEETKRVLTSKYDDLKFQKEIILQDLDDSKKKAENELAVLTKVYYFFVFF
jgi:hypothetical protein